MKELNNIEMENTSGGIIPAIVGAATAVAGHLTTTTLATHVISATGLAAATYGLAEALGPQSKN